MKWVRDTTGRLPERPHYDPAELDQECESLVAAFLRRKHGAVAYPLETNDLTILVEEEVDDLDLYADLSEEGTGVEGVTEFRSGARPTIRLSHQLSDVASKHQRLRTTLAHELGHVRFHAFLWKGRVSVSKPVGGEDTISGIRCHRESIVRARFTDWMEWQAGYACGALLMPASALDRVVKAEMERLRCAVPPFYGASVGKALVRRVQRAFDTSADAARIRLLQRGYLIREAPRPAFLARVRR